MLGTKSAESFHQDKKMDADTLDPLFEVSESNEESQHPPPDEAAEVPPRILGVFDVSEALTQEGLNNAIYELGIIDLCWPELDGAQARVCFPESYYTNSNKERLLLAYADNFRRKFIFKRGLL